MSFRPSILSWISQPAALLQRSTMRAPSTPALPFLRQPFRTHQVAPRATRRSLTTRTHRVTPTSRPGARSIPLPKQRANRRFNSGSSQSGSQAQKEGNSLSQRLRKLSREYGWATLGVYLALSALDFPFCFAAVRLLGVERIGHLEHVVIESVKDTFKSVWPQRASKPASENEEVGQGSLVRAEERNQEEASIWTQLALAYAIHKSFIFIRVPLTAAVTPKVVKVLRRWGWDIGKRKPKSS
ncbi:hypothetical protein N7492_002875 [Penicillium capsulatum]|uniref:DUF1279 domain-containing protein n=1 Tax=Penicillium capsulatum TaxID=69766 RepID=A0A9W9LW35_9EURO|nr:hypothetical protein N7492_002875 [Penicillium capsulatum]